MTKKLVIAAISLALGLTVVGTIAACTMSAEDKADLMVSHVSRKLDLNADQEKILEEIKAEALRIRAANRQKHAERARELIAMINSDQLDQQKIALWVDEKQAMVDQYSPWFIAKVAELHATLTPEQKEKMTDHIEKKHPQISKGE